MRDTSAADPLEAFARERGVTYVKLDGSVGILGNGAGLVDVDGRRGRRRGRAAGELLRPRRRRLGRGRRRGARGDRARRAGAVDPVQHLRRDHPLRRGRARDPGGARAGGDRGADRRAPRRHERRGGPAHPRRRGAARPRRRADDARRGPARRGAGGDERPWSERAQLYRDSKAHSEGADLDLVVEWAAGARPRSTSRPAAGTSRGGCARPGSRSSAATPRPACSPTSSASPRTCRSRTASFDSRVTRVAAHHFADVAAAVAELARVARDRVVVVDNLYLATRRSRRPRGSATRRTSATTARRSGAASSTAAGLAVEEVRRFDFPIELEPWLERTACTARTPRACASCSPTGSTAPTRARPHRAPRGRPRLMAILVDRETRLRRAGPDRQRGPLLRPAQPRLRHERRRRRHAREGRPGRRRDPGLRHRRRRRRRRPARTRRSSSSPRASPPTRSTRRPTRASRPRSASPSTSRRTTCCGSPRTSARAA